MQDNFVVPLQNELYISIKAASIHDWGLAGFNPSYDNDPCRYLISTKYSLNLHS